MRAIKPMPLTAAQITTARTGLRGEGRVDQQNWDAQHLCFVAKASKQQTMRKLVQPTVKGFVPLLALLKLQVLQSQDSISVHPCDEAFGDRLAVGFGEVSLAERQPFQHSAHTSRVLMLCLTLRQLSLQPCHLLAMLLSPNPQIQTAFKEDFTPLLHSNKQVRLVTVNADQDRARKGGFRERHTQIAYQPPIALLDGQAVKGEGVKEVAEKVVRDRKSQAFSPANRPDADRAIFFDGCVPLPFADEEDSEGLFEVDCARKFFAFPFGVAGSDETDGGASHLGADDTFNLMVSMLLKGTGVKGFATIPTDGRQSIADLLEGGQSRPEIWVLFNQG